MGESSVSCPLNKSKQEVLGCVSPNFTSEIKSITCHFRDTIVLAAPVRPNREQGGNGGPAVHCGREPSAQAELDQGRQPLGGHRKALFCSWQPAANHRGLGHQRCREVHVRNVQHPGHRERPRAPQRDPHAHLRLPSADGLGTGRRWLGHRGHCDHCRGLLCGGHLAGVGGHHLPHTAAERRLQHHQHRCVRGSLAQAPELCARRSRLCVPESCVCAGVVCVQEWCVCRSRVCAQESCVFVGPPRFVSECVCCDLRPRHEGDSFVSSWATMVS